MWGDGGAGDGEDSSITGGGSGGVGLGGVEDKRLFTSWGFFELSVKTTPKTPPWKTRIRILVKKCKGTNGVRTHSDVSLFGRNSIKESAVGATQSP